MEERIEIGLLYDFYGPLLTERRAELVRLYCEEDWSLTEIAAELGVSRQGVYDALRHAKGKLLGYEQKLKLMARWLDMERAVAICREQLSAVTPAPGSESALDMARRALERIEYVQREI